MHKDLVRRPHRTDYASISTDTR